jgi:hypothetical protein
MQQPRSACVSVVWKNSKCTKFRFECKDVSQEEMLQQPFVFYDFVLIWSLLSFYDWNFHCCPEKNCLKNVCPAADPHWTIQSLAETNRVVSAMQKRCGNIFRILLVSAMRALTNPSHGKATLCTHLFYRSHIGR